MRIRKRFLSLYGGAVTPPPPPSDLTGGNHHQPSLPPVQHQQQLHPNNNIQHVGSNNNNNNNLPDPSNQCLPPSSSAHTTKIGLQPSTWTSSGDTKIFNEMKSESKKELIGKEGVLCAEANNHDLVMKGWLQGDRLVTTKKKRGSYGRRLNNDVVQDNNKMSAKKNKSVIMEGSRCSRVNGRGWRCSQQTLVGYSLCEHHLGKGRVRSMNSGRAQTVAPKEKQIKERKVKKAESSLWDHDEVEDDSDDDEDVEGFKDWDVESMSSVEGTKVVSKKKKLGMVKARSLSSLLCQISR
ncbi:uncharacterized protein LOC143546707 [Bidens hawaiensis]|uniref:uncharacterized protein LOC143546707 n=1 Tax=Bidens hawaiensis TaxID=980011 RepID=UPI00404B186F